MLPLHASRPAKVSSPRLRPDDQRLNEVPKTRGLFEGGVGPTKSCVCVCVCVITWIDFRASKKNKGDRGGSFWESPEQISWYSGVLIGAPYIR